MAATAQSTKSMRESWYWRMISVARIMSSLVVKSSGSSPRSTKSITFRNGWYPMRVVTMYASSGSTTEGNSASCSSSRACQQAECNGSFCAIVARRNPVSRRAVILCSGTVQLPIFPRPVLLNPAHWLWLIQPKETALSQPHTFQRLQVLQENPQQAHYLAYLVRQMPAELSRSRLQQRFQMYPHHRRRYAGSTQHLPLLGWV